MNLSKYELFGLVGATFSFATYLLLPYLYTHTVVASRIIDGLFSFLVLAGVVLAILYILKQSFDYRKIFILLFGYIPFLAAIYFLILAYFDLINKYLAVWSMSVIVIPIGFLTYMFRPLQDAYWANSIYVVPLMVVFNVLIWTLAIGLTHRGLILVKKKIYGR